MSVVRARAKASFQKKLGHLVLTQRSLSWTEDKQKEPRLNLPNTSLQKMFFSKPGSASTSMKVMDGPDPKLNAYTFVFTSSKAVAEGNNFKEMITNILTQNIAQQQAQLAREQAATTDTQAAAPVTITPRADRPLSVNDLRKSVLLKRLDLAALHRELVITGSLSEAEFWAGREHLLSAEESLERQRKGRPTQMLELRGAGTNEKGDIKITITPERAQQIFIEYPVVKRLYLQKEDDGDEPLHQRPPASSLLIDLNATNEDHGETGNSKDFTMKAGGLRSTLPLIRKFNEHSTNVLDAGLQPSKRQRIEHTDEVYYSQLDMEDLRGPINDAGIELGLQSNSRMLDSDNPENGAANGQHAEPVDTQALVGTLRSWHNQLSKFAPGKKPVEDAFTSLSQNVTERINVNSRKNNLPEDLLQAMGNLQTATSEFLRQFWSALYEEKESGRDRLDKMASYLLNTHTKIAPMMTAAKNQGHDPQVVRDAFMPTLDAVNKALAIYKTRAST
ncbi:General transcription factor IIH subunit 1 [Rhizoctonia solani]|uniref:General transcription factor IIH subunit 1 n=1 Tax=Rhizoctonia solani TaxID=456999 RepID=A0A0K6FL91_9AGAM|nr:General transcription factor IIH subunit 1 [Rhizoctonia solani]